MAVPGHPEAACAGRLGPVQPCLDARQRKTRLRLGTQRRGGPHAGRAAAVEASCQRRCCLCRPAEAFDGLRRSCWGPIQVETSPRPLPSLTFRGRRAGERSGPTSRNRSGNGAFHAWTNGLGIKTSPMFQHRIRRDAGHTAQMLPLCWTSCVRAKPEVKRSSCDDGGRAIQLRSTAQENGLDAGDWQPACRRCLCTRHEGPPSAGCPWSPDNVSAAPAAISILVVDFETAREMIGSSEVEGLTPVFTGTEIR